MYAGYYNCSQFVYVQYIPEYVQSQLLARKLAYFCCKQLAQYFHESGGYISPRTQSPAVTTAQNGLAVSVKACFSHISDVWLFVFVSDN